jgi:hypothetical protein
MPSALYLRGSVLASFCRSCTGFGATHFSLHWGRSSQNCYHRKPFTDHSFLKLPFFKFSGTLLLCHLHWNYITCVSHLFVIHTHNHKANVRRWQIRSIQCTVISLLPRIMLVVSMWPVSEYLLNEQEN